MEYALFQVIDQNVFWYKKVIGFFDYQYLEETHNNNI